MSDRSDHEARIAALEARMEEVAADAAAARHLAAAGDRDLADLGIKVDANSAAIADLAVTVDANRAAINALGLQTAGRFGQMDQRFDAVDQRFDRLEGEVRSGFGEMRGRLDRTATGQERLAELLTGLIDRGGET